MVGMLQYTGAIPKVRLKVVIPLLEKGGYLSAE
jgi:hypothetical protein